MDEAFLYVDVCIYHEQVFINRPLDGKAVTESIEVFYYCQRVHFNFDCCTACSIWTSNLDVSVLAATWAA